MLFENLTVDRLIIHEVHRRLDDKRRVSPTYGDQPLALNADALSVFRERVIAAIGSQSQSMEMAIAKHDAGSAVEIAQSLLMTTNFAHESRRFADKLADVQISRNLPGGVVVVFVGTAGNPAQRIVGIMKAETHGGFRRTANMQVEYFKDLFLTPQTKLYKIGVFASGNAAPGSVFPRGWTATIYDSQMSNSNRDGAAQYFYEHFLGCALPINSAQLTKKFFEGTRDFINALSVPEEDKADLLTGLYTYLRVDQSPTVEISRFSNQYLGAAFKDDYELFMGERQFPANAVPKDISDIQGYLRKRKLTFSRNIQLTAPPDAFKDLIQVQTIAGDEDVNGATPVWTQITIRDRIRDQE